MSCPKCDNDFVCNQCGICNNCGVDVDKFIEDLKDSKCCSARFIEETDVCSKCGEHSE